MKALLVKPSFYKNIYKPTAKPPLGIAYIASALEQDGHEVKILDMYSLALNKDDLLKVVEDFKPDVVGFSVLTPFMTSAASYAQLIKEYDNNVKIIVGGIHPSAGPEKILGEYPQIDISIYGEGEITTRDLLKHFEEGKNPDEVLGIAFRKDSKVILNPPRPLIKNIDEIPFPAWHLLPMEAYLKDYEYRWEDSYKPKNQFMILTTRGCPGRCTFCDSHRVWQRRIRFRSAANIIEELKLLKEKYKVEYIIINDDTFTLRKSRAIEFCNKLIEENLNMEWECKARVNFVDSEMLKYMKKAGCQLICYGAESGSQEVLDFIKKGITLEQIKGAKQITKEAGIKAHFFWMIGFPVETKEHILQTMRFIIDLKADNLGLPSVLVPYPSTDIYEYMVSNGLILEEDYDKFWKVHEELENGNTPIRTHYLTNKELMDLKKFVDSEIKKDFYKRMILKYTTRPHLLLGYFIKNPKFIISYMKDAVKTMSK